MRRGTGSGKLGGSGWQGVSFVAIGAQVSGLMTGAGVAPQLRRKCWVTGNNVATVTSCAQLHPACDYTCWHENHEGHGGARMD